LNDIKKARHIYRALPFFALCPSLLVATSTVLRYNSTRFKPVSFIATARFPNLPNSDS